VERRAKRRRRREQYLDPKAEGGRRIPGRKARSRPQPGTESSPRRKPDEDRWRILRRHAVISVSGGAGPESGQPLSAYNCPSSNRE